MAVVFCWSSLGFLHRSLRSNSLFFAVILLNVAIRLPSLFGITTSSIDQVISPLCIGSMAFPVTHLVDVGGPTVSLTWIHGCCAIPLFLFDAVILLNVAIRLPSLFGVTTSSIHQVVSPLCIGSMAFPVTLLIDVGGPTVSLTWIQGCCAIPLIASDLV